MVFLQSVFAYVLSLICLLSRTATASFNFSIENFSGIFASDSGVLQSLKPATELDFDFSPSDYFSLRTADRQYHTGDLTFRWRSLGNHGNIRWQDVDTSANRSALTPIWTSPNGPWTSSLNNAIGAASSVFNVTRTWDQIDGDLTLTFKIKNVAAYATQLGSLGMPIEFNNIFVNRTPEEVTAKCVFLDPYIGLHAGYVQATRLTGTGPNLVITGLTNETKLEAWRFLREPTDTPLGYQLQTYEGNYEWQVLSEAYAVQEWKTVKPWNLPTSRTLQAGESITVGLRFSIAPQTSDIEDIVSRNGKSVAVGIPGFVLPYDMIGKVFINSTMSIDSITVTPEGSLVWHRNSTFSGSWQGFEVRPASGFFGRASMCFGFNDNSSHIVHYWIAESSPLAVSELGSYTTKKQWYTDRDDPFQRAPSILSYDHGADAFVTQDNRSWIAGLNNEGGAGSWVAAAIKQAYWPDPREVAILETYFNETVWGLQQSNGSSSYVYYDFPGNASQAKYGIRDSLFYYGMKGYNYTAKFNWTGQPGIEDNYRINRAYDYVWNSALYWSLYKAGRVNPGILSRHDPTWYLMLSYHTIMFSQGQTNGQHNVGYWNVGLMGETHWGEVLNDLVAENFAKEAAALERVLRSRQALWASESNPYGSELAWDSTGEEGIYYWSQRFGDTITAKRTIERIRGYMPTVAHWGWNGNARRYWDFLYAGAIETSRVERQIHHYGSPLNALPLLSAYRNASDPQSLASIHDLRTGYGGNMGSLTNIGQDGFGAAAFHSFPDTLAWDAYTGDYGCGFLGQVLGAVSYLVKHPLFYWQAFGANIISGGALRDTDSTPIIVEPKDSIRKRIFIAPLSLFVTFDNGVIANFSYLQTAGSVEITVLPTCAAFGTSMRQACPVVAVHSPANDTVNAIMKFEQLGGKTGLRLDQKLSRRSGGYLVRIRPKGTTISFSSVADQSPAGMS